MARKRKGKGRGGTERPTPVEQAPSPRAPVVLAPSWGPPQLRYVLTALAFAYLAGIVLSGAKSKLHGQVFHRVPLYFTQVACLFPNAARASIDYRLEAWDCAAQDFVEIDHRAHFPIRRDDKESRFHRLGQFHRRERSVMEAFEAFIVSRENRALGEARIGGVRFSSLRIPLPERGQKVERITHHPLSVYPEDQRKMWFQTPNQRRRTWCDGEVPSASQSLVRDGDPTRFDDYGGGP